MMLKVRNGAARSAATQPVEKTEYPIVPPPKPQRHNSQHQEYSLRMEERRVGTCLNWSMLVPPSQQFFTS
jgi:hypothetical protein